MLFYPVSGMMRRKIVIPGQYKLNPQLVISARSSMAQWNPSQASLDRVYHFDVNSSPEGAILSGRWVPLETLGEYAMGMMPDDVAFGKIIESIKKGGLPVRDSPKWNEFWATTGDGWMFGGNDPTGGGDSAAILDPSEVGGVGNLIPPAMTPMLPGAGSGSLMPISGQGQFQLMGSIGKLETEGGALTDIIQAPTPTYGDEDEMGFLEG